MGSSDVSYCSKASLHFPLQLVLLHNAALILSDVAIENEPKAAAEPENNTFGQALSKGRKYFNFYHLRHGSLNSCLMFSYPEAPASVSGLARTPPVALHAPSRKTPDPTLYAHGQ
jgi:hypothetical protein